MMDVKLKYENTLVLRQRSDIAWHYQNMKFNISKILFSHVRGDGRKIDKSYEEGKIFLTNHFFH